MIKSMHQCCMPMDHVLVLGYTQQDLSGLDSNLYFRHGHLLGFIMRSLSNLFMFGWFLFPVFIFFSLKLSNEEMKRAIMTMDEQEDLPKDMLEQVCTMENYNCKKGFRQYSGFFFF